MAATPMEIHHEAPGHELDLRVFCAGKYEAWCECGAKLGTFVGRVQGRGPIERACQAHLDHVACLIG